LGASTTTAGKGLEFAPGNSSAGAIVETVAFFSSMRTGSLSEGGGGDCACLALHPQPDALSSSPVPRARMASLAADRAKDMVGSSPSEAGWSIVKGAIGL